MNNHIEVAIHPIGADLAETMIAALSEIGFDGFLEEKNTLKAYILSNGFDNNQLNNLMNKYGLRYSLSTIKEQNWNAVWESNFSPVVVDDFVGIRAFFS